MELDRGEILRYMGAQRGGGALDGMVDRAEKLVADAARPRHVYRLVDVLPEAGGIVLGGAEVESESLAGHLAGCGQAFLFACTLGPGVDVLIKRYTIAEMPLVPVLQACAAAFIEAYADKAQAELEEYAKGKGLFLRSRYSPGYGDFPLCYQRLFFDALEIPKRLGVFLTENFLMVPFKSITAVVGLSSDPSSCHVRRCMVCKAQGCPFRKEDMA